MAHQKKVAVGLILLALLLLTLGVYINLKTQGLLLTPKEKFAKYFEEDMALLKKSGKLPKEWDQVKSLQVRAQGSLAQQLAASWKPSIKGNDKGKLVLDIFITDIIDVNSRGYAALVEFSLLDPTSNNNTIAQFGRTLKIGYLF